MKQARHICRLIKHAGCRISNIDLARTYNSPCQVRFFATVDSSDDASSENNTAKISNNLSNLPTVIPYKSRLETHYYQTLLEDLLVLTYDHYSPDATLDVLQSKHYSEWMNSPNTDTPFTELYSLAIRELPTSPYTSKKENNHVNVEKPVIVTNLLSKQASEVDYFKRPKPKYGRTYLNPIDYTPVKKEILRARPEMPPPPPYAPLPSRFLNIKSIQLRVWSKEAASNKNIILSCIMTLQSITGIRAEPLFATAADASRDIRAGMALGAYCTLRGPTAYQFLDKLITCVLPRMNDWEGINPIGNGKAGITFKLSGQAVGLFPDIEPHFDSFPRLNDLDVLVETSGRNDGEAVLLLSGFQMPFLERKVVVKSEKEDGVFDPWAQFRTRRERETGVLETKRASKPTMTKKKS